ncbi:Metalloprotease PmbA [Candidatus Entotheonellaceae bacterium PAL068K]
MQQQGAIDYVLALAHDHQEPDVDLILERDEELTLRVFDGRVEKVDQATALGLGVRVVHEGRTGIAYTERLGADALEKAFVAARDNARLNDPTEVIMPAAPPQVPEPQTLELYNPELQSLTVDTLGDFGLQIETTARQADPRVTAVSRLIVSRSSSEYRVVSAHGVDYRQRQNSIGAFCQVLMEDRQYRKSGDCLWTQRTWDPTQAPHIAKMAVAKAAALLLASPITGGQLPVVLDEYCAPHLLSLFLGCFSAEAAQKGQSRLRGKQGEMIADKAISLTDEPHRVGASGSRYVDAEGVVTCPLSLITAGRFESFLYHIESGRREGRASSGHAGRGYTGGIVTTSHNLVMPTGDHTLDELIGLPESCLLVTQLEGAAGCNSLSGDISIGVQGFWVEQGQRRQPVDSITIAGNFFELLKSIRARGTAYQPNLSRRFIPPLLVDGLAVSS